MVTSACETGDSECIVLVVPYAFYPAELKFTVNVPNRCMSLVRAVFVLTNAPDVQCLSNSQDSTSNFPALASKFGWDANSATVCWYERLAAYVAGVEPPRL